MGKNTNVLFTLTCLLGITALQVLVRHVNAGDSTGQPPCEGTQLGEAEVHKATQSTEEAVATVGEEKKEKSERSGNEETGKAEEEKEQRRNTFPVGHKIEVQVHHGVYVIERSSTSPDVLTISLQLPDGRQQQYGFVPMSEVTAMLEEAESLGSGLPQALLDAKFLSYAFDQDESAVELTKPDIMTTTKLAQEFIEAEAQAEEQERIKGKKQTEDEDEDGEEEDDEDVEEEDGEEEDEDEEDEGEKKNEVHADTSLRGATN